MSIEKVLVCDSDETVNRAIERERKNGLVCVSVVPATVSGRRDSRDRELQLVCSFERVPASSAGAAAPSVPPRPTVPPTLRDLKIEEYQDSLPTGVYARGAFAPSGACRESAVACRSL